MNRLLWVEKPNYKNNKYKFLEKEQHCGNCANSGRNGCLTAIILSETNDTVVVQSRCSGEKRPYPKTFLSSKGKIEDLIATDLTNHRNWKKFGTIKGKGQSNMNILQNLNEAQCQDTLAMFNTSEVATDLRIEDERKVSFHIPAPKLGKKQGIKEIKTVACLSILDILEEALKSIKGQDRITQLQAYEKSFDELLKLIRNEMGEGQTS